MLTIKYETGFKKDYKRIVKRGYVVSLLEEVIDLLANKIPLQKNIRIMAFLEIMSDFENVILLLIGF